MQDLSSPTRDWTCAPCMWARSLNHWATGQVPGRLFFFLSVLYRDQNIIAKGLVVSLCCHLPHHLRAAVPSGTSQKSPQFYIHISVGLFSRMGFPGVSVKKKKKKSANAGDVGSIPGSGRSLEKEMPIHSSILAWRVSWTEEPGGPQSMVLQTSRTWLSKWITMFGYPEQSLLSFFFGKLR